MSNDPKQSKTIMGWSPQIPGQQPGQAWPPQPQGQAPQPQAQPPQQQGWPPPQQQAPQAPPAWGQVPQAQPPAPQPAWNQPPQQPPQPAWNQPPQAQPPQPAWNQPPQPAWNQPPQQPAWGQQPPQQPQAQAWDAPPQQAQPAWSPPAMPAMPMASPQASGGRAIANADATTGVSARVRFIRLTYLHLLGAILAFTGIEWLLFTNSMLREKVSAPLVNFALGGRFNWGIVLAVFTGASIATHWLASQSKSRPLHYVGLVLYVIAEALIFVPLLAIVEWKTQEILARGGGNPNIIRDAAFITLGVFGALTASVLISKKDFSFLRSGLMVAGAAAMGLIVLSLAFGFNLGIVFAVAMVLLAAGQILYETSQILAHADPEAYVGASLSLFSSIALLFWYIIQIVMKLRD
ncbi:MAG: Bax inhibitor-1 family protein [Deltaproteobacteria bacterium]|nr:Bax inhibitor-1 family protein [Deltaproteobacteria bacterium]